MFDQTFLQSPIDPRIKVYPGAKIRLGRFETTVWIVAFGWYAYGGNRPVCGWYLTDICDPGNVKPLQLTDFDDIILIQN